MGKKYSFKPLAEKRVNFVIKRLLILEGLSNVNKYEYTEEQVDEMFKRINKEVRWVEKMFRRGLNFQSKKNDKFEF